MSPNEPFNKRNFIAMLSETILFHLPDPILLPRRNFLPTLSSIASILDQAYNENLVDSVIVRKNASSKTSESRAVVTDLPPKLIILIQEYIFLFIIVAS